jgi:hypothetical protein
MISFKVCIQLIHIYYNISGAWRAKPSDRDAIGIDNKIAHKARVRSEFFHRLLHFRLENSRKGEKERWKQHGKHRKLFSKQACRYPVTAADSAHGSKW